MKISRRQLFCSLIFLTVLVLCLFLRALPAGAQDLVQIGEGIRVPTGEEANSTVTIFGPTRIDGLVQESAVTIFGPAEINGHVGESAVIVGGSATINGTVRQDTIIVGGSAEVNGEVNGDLTLIGGSLHLTDKAKIHGNLTEVGSSLTSDPGATVGGNKLNITLRQALVGELGRWLAGYPFPSPLSPLFWWRLAGLLLLAVVVVIVGILFPGAANRIAGELASHPGQDLLWGLLVVILALPATILLLVTILGIPLALLLWLALACAYYLGLTGLSSLIGGRLVMAASDQKPALFLGTLVGILIIGVITWLPFVGLAAGGLLKLTGLGAVTATLVHRRPR